MCYKLYVTLYLKRKFALKYVGKVRKILRNHIHIHFTTPYICITVYIMYRMFIEERKV